jgi:hypothetical protein
MSRVGGPSDPRPVAGAEKRGAEKPADEGEFDRVMEEHAGPAGDEGTTPLPGASLRRSLRGGPQKGGGDPTGTGGGSGSSQPGDSSGPLPQPAIPRRGPALPGQGPAAQAAGAGPQAPIPEGAASPKGEQTPGGLPLQPARASAQQPPPPFATTATDQQSKAGEAASRAAGAGEKLPELPADEDSLPADLPVEALAAETRVIPPPLTPGAAPVGPAAEIAPPSPAGDPALVRQVAQQVLAGIEVHMVAGRTQVDLGIDLGALGQANVELSRLPGEGVKLVFRIDTADAQQAVSRNLHELVQALEQKGMTPQIDLRRGDGSPLGGDPQRRGQQQGDQQQGRSRGEYIPAVEEES